MQPPKIAFLGAGRMASAIISGLIERQLFAPQEIACTSANDGTGPALAERLGIRFEPDASVLLDTSDFVVLAIKPQQLQQLPASRQHCQASLMISILAGTPLAKLRSVFPEVKTHIRAMPNTPGQIHAGVTAFTSEKPLATDEASLVRQVLEALGQVYEVAESQMDAITALSGSGPAYVFEFIAGLRDAGAAAGLELDLAYQVAVQTTLGASQLLQAVPASPEQHRDWVASPGGTTEAGLRELAARDFRGILQQTVAAAKQRSVELAG